MVEQFSVLDRELGSESHRPPQSAEIRCSQTWGAQRGRNGEALVPPSGGIAALPNRIDGTQDPNEFDR